MSTTTLVPLYIRGHAGQVGERAVVADDAGQRSVRVDPVERQHAGAGRGIGHRLRAEVDLAGGLGDARGGSHRQHRAQQPQRGRVREPQPAAAGQPRHPLDPGGGLLVAAHAGGGHGQRHTPPQAEGGQHGSAGRRSGQRRDAHGHHRQGRDRQVGCEAEAEAGAVEQRGQRLRIALAPALRHLAAHLGQRQTHQAQLGGRLEQGEDGDGCGHGRAARGQGCAQRQAQETGGGDGACGEQGERQHPCACPVHDGDDGLHHREPSGRPGTGHAGDQRAGSQRRVGVERDGQHGVDVW